MSDELDQLRRSIYRMRYWAVLPCMVGMVVLAVVSVREGRWGVLPGLTISCLALGSCWTTTGWFRDKA